MCDSLYPENLAMRCRTACTVGSRAAAPPSMAVVEVRTRVTEPRTGERVKSGSAIWMTRSHSAGVSSWCRYRTRGE
eukprot:scaffold2857_cov121-Isochrysis_galbana.AAC.1